MYAAVSPSLPRRSFRRRRPTVLIVDDKPDIRLSYRLLLEVEGFEVLDAPNPRSALATLRDHAIDVVLVDLYMPDYGDGLGLIKAVRQHFEPAPALIAMSGAHHLGYRSSLAAAYVVGADVTLTKPVSRQTLLDAIRELRPPDPELP